MPFMIMSMQTLMWMGRIMMFDEDCSRLGQMVIKWGEAVKFGRIALDSSRVLGSVCE